VERLIWELLITHVARAVLASSFLWTSHASHISQFDLRVLTHPISILPTTSSAMRTPTATPSITSDPTGTDSDTFGETHTSACLYSQYDSKNRKVYIGLPSDSTRLRAVSQAMEGADASRGGDASLRRYARRMSLSDPGLRQGIDLPQHHMPVVPLKTCLKHKAENPAASPTPIPDPPTTIDVPKKVVHIADERTCKQPPRFPQSRTGARRTPSYYSTMNKSKSTRLTDWVDSFRPTIAVYPEASGPRPHSIDDDDELVTATPPNSQRTSAAASRLSSRPSSLPITRDHSYESANSMDDDDHLVHSSPFSDIVKTHRDSVALAKKRMRMRERRARMERGSEGSGGGGGDGSGVGKHIRIAE
jgi:hypothetical protein